MATVNLGRVGLVLKGKYDNAATYEKLDVVTFGGACYIAKMQTTGHEPPNEDYWQLQSERGAQGDKGEKGEKGDKGDQGIQGPPGSSEAADYAAGIALAAAKSADEATKNANAAINTANEAAELANIKAELADNAANKAKSATEAALQAVRDAQTVINQAIDLVFFIDENDFGLNARILKEGF